MGIRSKNVAWYRHLSDLLSDSVQADHSDIAFDLREKHSDKFTIKAVSLFWRVHKGVPTAARPAFPGSHFVEGRNAGLSGESIFLGRTVIPQFAGLNATNCIAQALPL